MNNFCELTVKFHCCGEIRTFTQPREFHMCNCGSSGYDVGDSFYSRILGNPDDVKIVGYDIQKNKEYCKNYGLEYYPEEGLATKAGTPYFIKLDKGRATLMKNVEEKGSEFIGHFTTLKMHANV